MITLENVSTESFIEFTTLEEIACNNSTYKFIRDLLIKNNITNFKMLKELLQQNKSIMTQNKIAYELLICRINMIEESLAIINFSNERIELFTFNNYEKTKIDDETALITDKNNNGIVLPYTFPFINKDPKLKFLNELSIAKIKELLSSVDSYDLTKCALIAKRNIRKDTVLKVLYSLDFYEQQIIRQSFETEQRRINLFTLNKEEKNKIISSNLKEYAEYILDNSILTIWGKVTPTAKNKLYSAVLSTRGEYTTQTKKNLIDAISNYTTLKELETGILTEQEVPIIMGGVITRKKTKPIDRFII